MATSEHGEVLGVEIWKAYLSKYDGAPPNDLRDLDSFARGHEDRKRLGRSAAAPVARSREDIALSRDGGLVPVVGKPALQRLRDAGCLDAPATASAPRPTREDDYAGWAKYHEGQAEMVARQAPGPDQATRVGQLLGEMDHHSAAAGYRAEAAAKLKPAALKLDFGGVGY
jgi:hypothetical protein